MNRLALGAVQFGLPYGIANQRGQVTQAIAGDILRLAAAGGIDTLDTAIAYGESEACLGAVGVGAFRVVTKLPAMPDGCEDVAAWVRQEVDLSLKRLRVSQLHGLLLHRPMQLLATGGAELYRAMMALKVEGRVKKIGISVYAPDELAVLVPRFRFDLVQAPLNLVDRRLQASGWLDRLKQLGIEVHTRSAFLQGLLLLPSTLLPRKFAPWTDLWSRWQGWLNENAVSPVQACLVYPLACPEVDRVVVGVDGPEQLTEIMMFATGRSDMVLPDIGSVDENLINPANWSAL